VDRMGWDEPLVVLYVIMAALEEVDDKSEGEWGMRGGVYSRFACDGGVAGIYGESNEKEVLEAISRWACVPVFPVNYEESPSSFFRTCQLSRDMNGDVRSAGLCELGIISNIASVIIRSSPIT
jgi:hypothetical protein